MIMKRSINGPTMTRRLAAFNMLVGGGCMSSCQNALFMLQFYAVAGQNAQNILTKKYNKFMYLKYKPSWPWKLKLKLTI